MTVKNESLLRCWARGERYQQQRRLAVLLHVTVARRRAQMKQQRRRERMKWARQSRGQKQM